GPVNSRRLGRSLGVDVIPPKTCTFDCIYCELGRTTHLTLKRRPYAVKAIIREIQEYFQEPRVVPDFVTLAGSGEPTLNAGLKEIIAAVQAVTDTPVAVLTNGALLYRAEVRRDLQAAQVVLPSLDAAREETFRHINRPAPGLAVDLLVTGLEAFRQEFAGQLWLEVMLLRGINDQEPELAALKEAIARIRPDKVQLNTAVRPVAEAYAHPLSREEMSAIAAYLGEGAEVIADFSSSHRAAGSVTDRTLLDMLARRPMTARDLAQALGLPLSQVEKQLHRLESAGLIARDFYQQEGFFRNPTPLNQA
ncbi:MAG: radical SAM protein, partial [Deltaproteobacteria bacterium]|nr:radical SAM protein [Deltaproteobacteria bacterium]